MDNYTGCGYGKPIICLVCIVIYHVNDWQKVSILSGLPNVILITITQTGRIIKVLSLQSLLWLITSEMSGSCVVAVIQLKSNSFREHTEKRNVSFMYNIKVRSTDTLVE